MDLIFLLFLFFTHSQLVFSMDDQPPKLILISLDGLRYDFITKERTPNLYIISRQGVLLEHGMKTQVITTTSPNHYSMVTGLYQESHGIIDNTFWDPVFNENYDYWYWLGNRTAYKRSKMAYWYEGTTPIWQTNEDGQYSNGYNEKNRRRSGSLNWPTGDCPINNKEIFKNISWSSNGNEESWKKEMDKMIDWLTDDKEPVNFLLYYNSQPDHVEHQGDVYGPDVQAVVKELDNTMGYMVEKLKEVKLWNNINIIFTSDHGHTNVFDSSRFIHLENYLDFNKVILNGRSLFPKPGKNVTADEIYRNLTKAQVENRYPMQVWRKEEFPIQYHYANHHRIGPIILFEQLNHVFSFERSHFSRFHHGKRMPIGNHGWLNDFTEMRSFFIGYGPAFKSKYLVYGHDEIENVDLYPLMCQILRIHPLPNNGSLERIKFILRDKSDPPANESLFNLDLCSTMELSEKSNAAVVVFCVISAISITLTCMYWLVCVIRKRILLICTCCRKRRLNSSAKNDFEVGSGYRRLFEASVETCVDESTSNTLETKNEDSITGRNLRKKISMEMGSNGNKSGFSSGQEENSIDSTYINTGPVTGAGMKPDN